MHRIENVKKKIILTRKFDKNFVVKQVLFNNETCYKSVVKPPLVTWMLFGQWDNTCIEVVGNTVISGRIQFVLTN